MSNTVGSSLDQGLSGHGTTLLENQQDLVCPAQNAVKVLFAANNQAVRKRFGAGALDDGRLTSAKRALKNRLEGMAPGEAALRTFISQEASSLVLPYPRPMVVGGLEVDLANLVDELVGEMPPAHRTRARLTP